MPLIIFQNKKVLLRERKRHTARRIASTCYAALSHPDLVGRYPIQTWSGGTPSRPGWGVPWVLPTIQTWSGVPQVPPTIWTWDGEPPDLRWGTTPPRPGTGYPQPGMGYPPTIQTWDGVPLPEMGYPPT